ncbi:MAG: NUDIX domain-containing protein [Bacilli bacterium]|nr:NUDIX domain-containing protein [Bacilli bacterium]
MNCDEKACGGIIIKDGKVLMVKQVKGFTGFPKGHTEKGETEIETAIREIKEETNVDVKLDDSKSYRIYYSPNPNISKEVVYYLGKVVDDNNPLAQEGEVTEVIWVDIDKVEETLSFENIKEMWKKVQKDIDIDK